MLRYLFTLTAILFYSNISFAQNYGSKISDDLIGDADAVIRNYSTIYKRTSERKFERTVTYAITILNPKGSKHANIFVPYDRNSKVSYIKGKVFDKNGKQIVKLKEKNIADMILTNSFTLFSDHRAKALGPNPLPKTYPFTVEYSYSTSHTQVVGFSPWIPNMDYNVAVESADLSFSTKSSLPLNSKEVNHNFKSSDSMDGDYATLKWNVKNLKAIKQLNKSPHFLDFFPAVLLSPEDIAYEGTKGDFKTWKSYGEWVNGLIIGRDQVPEKTTIEIRKLTEHLTDEREKTKLIYEYMQNKTRYVNIALGIGGFQPLKAEEVDEKGYGDCKALSNYTKALLNTVGIESHYTEIGVGDSHEIKHVNFPSANQTNHIILCVPLKKDSVWLECTSQKLPFGYISSGSQDRHALLIKNSGGTLVKTPTFKPEQNIRNSKISITASEKGQADFRINTEFINGQYENIFPQIYTSKEEQRKAIKNAWTSESRIWLDDLAINDTSDDKAKATLSASGNLRKYFKETGSGLIFKPEFFFNTGLPASFSKARSIDIIEPMGYTYTDTLDIALPGTYRSSSSSTRHEYESIYGSYSQNVSLSRTSARIVRNLRINSGTYTSEQINEINEFLKQVSASEKRKIFLEKVN